MPFTRIAWTRFEQALKSAGIEHRLIRPRSPKSNGKVERFIKTIDDECLRITQPQSSRARVGVLKLPLVAPGDKYYAQRFQTDLGWRKSFRFGAAGASRAAAVRRVQRLQRQSRSVAVCDLRAAARSAAGSAGGPVDAHRGAVPLLTRPRRSNKKGAGHQPGPLYVYFPPCTFHFAALAGGACRRRRGRIDRQRDVVAERRLQAFDRAVLVTAAARAAADADRRRSSGRRPRSAGRPSW